MVYQDIETVTLYLNPQRQNANYDYILGLNPKRVIFNPGTENPEFYKLLNENNIYYEVACTLILLQSLYNVSMVGNSDNLSRVILLFLRKFSTTNDCSCLRDSE